jgi:hypothetical protein
VSKTDRIILRVSPGEKAALKERAGAAGLGLSAFLLWRGLGQEKGSVTDVGAGEDGRVSPPDVPAPSRAQVPSKLGRVSGRGEAPKSARSCRRCGQPNKSFGYLCEKCLKNL